jgi:DNA-binding protein Fis
MPRKPRAPLSDELREAILAMPVEDLLRLRLEPLVQAVYRRQGTQVHKQILDSVSRVLVELALKKTAGNASQASEILGVSRNTLGRRIIRPEPPPRPRPRSRRTARP